MYTGLVIKESLKNPDILSEFEIIKTETDDDWHLHTIRVDEAGLKTVKNNLSDNRWYAHFADKNTGIVVFKDRIFKMSRSEKETWRAAIEYGISIGIPAGQMDFEFDAFDE